MVLGQDTCMAIFLGEMKPRSLLIEAILCRWIRNYVAMTVEPEGSA
jgi:hypothetical protein